MFVLQRRALRIQLTVDCFVCFLLQIRSKEWCTYEKPGGKCNMKCESEYVLRGKILVLAVSVIGCITIFFVEYENCLYNFLFTINVISLTNFLKSNNLAKNRLRIYHLKSNQKLFPHNGCK